MYFTDRVELGKTLSRELEGFRGKDAIILCLKESSLLTCLTMARELRAWVYPLVFVPVYSQDAMHLTLGAIDETGAFRLHPETPAAVDKQPVPALLTALEGQRQAAVEIVKEKLANYDMALDKFRMNGRDVIVVGDILTSSLPLEMGLELLSTVSPESLTIVVGNATPAVADQVRLSADITKILDIESGIISDDDHYFRHPDGYTPQQKYKLTQHIATYWQ